MNLQKAREMYMDHGGVDSVADNYIKMLVEHIKALKESNTEMLEVMINEYKIIKELLESGLILAGEEMKKTIFEILIKKCDAIEKATGNKIKEVIKWMI